MKKVLLTAVVVLFALTANAQIKVGIGAGLGLPMGDFGDGFKSGFGGAVTGKYMLSENMAVGLNIGYYSFKSKASDDIKLSMMPITGLFNYYFATEGFKPYAGADLGFYSAKVKSDIAGFSFSTSETKFGFAPVVGFEYGLGETMNLDVNAKYNMVSDANFVTINVGINMVFGN